MKRTIQVVAAFLLLASVVTARAGESEPPRRRDTGIAGSPNFTVLAPPGDYLADAVLKNAERYRREIAKTWLGRELREGRELAHINVKLSDTKDRGVTWLCGPGKALPGDHRIWIKTSRRLALGATLKHEITHIVFASSKLPPWVQEGIASTYDDDAAKGKRSAIRKAWIRNGFPNVATVLEARVIRHDDTVAYTVAESVVELLVDRHGKKKFFEFVENGVTQREFEEWVRK